MDGSQLTSWYEVAKGEVPLPLTGPSLNLSPLPAPHPPTIFLFGGKLVVQRRLTAEMWAFDVNSRTWSRVNAGKGPGARYFHSMDVWEDKLVCFGGMADNDPHSEKLNVHNDVWMFDCRSRRWLPQPSPEAPIGSLISDDETARGSPRLPGVQDPALLPTPRYAHLSAISRGKLIACGGQRLDNSWIYEMNVYDLKRNIWVSKTEQPESHGLHSKGAYRSVTASSPYRVIVPSGDSYTMTGAPALPYTVEEEGSGGDVWCYSNYDFAKVRRELEVISPLDDDSEENPTTSDKFSSPPGFAMKDLCNKVSGSSQPPGLRFPTGGIIGNHFVLCGLYLASTSAAFSIWTLDLTKHTWKHIEPPVLAHGSWNIVVLDPTAARLLIFGNAQSDLATDYSKRAVSLNHFAVVELEAFGVYQAPKLLLSEQTQGMGLSMLDEKLVSDFNIVCEDGRMIKCSRKVLTERWPWFAEQQASLVGKAGDMVQEMPSLDINDALLGSLSPARFTPNRLHLPEPLAVCVALVQYFYTLNLSTQLQNRAPVLCSLLFLSKRYKIERLAKLVVHALHSRLEPSNAIQVYEVAALAGEQNLSARALALVNPKSSSSSRHHHRRPGSSATAGEGSQSSHSQPQNSSTTPATGPSSAPPQSAPPTSGAGQGPSEHKETFVNALIADPLGLRLRSRRESETFPTELLEETMEDDDDREDLAVAQLMDALTLNTPPPLRTSTRRAPSVSSSSPISRPTSRTSNYSVSSNRARVLPPLLPPPGRPLPIRPENEGWVPSTPEAYHPRPYSPISTASDATSVYPRTPSESSQTLRDLSDPRSSIGSTPGKKSLPALLETEHILEERFRIQQSGSALADAVAQQRILTSTVPMDSQERSKLSRAVSLDSLGGGRNGNSIGIQSGHARTVSFRHRAPINSMDVEGIIGQLDAKEREEEYEHERAKEATKSASVKVKHQTMDSAFTFAPPGSDFVASGIAPRPVRTALAPKPLCLSEESGAKHDFGSRASRSKSQRNKLGWLGSKFTLSLQSGTAR